MRFERPGGRLSRAPATKGATVAVSRPISFTGRTSRPPLPVATGFDELLAGARTAVGSRGDWRQTAALAADRLRRHLPSPEVLTAEQRIGSPDCYDLPVRAAGTPRAA
jgi:hypothetical protein